MPNLQCRSDVHSYDDFFSGPSLKRRAGQDSRRSHALVANGLANAAVFQEHGYAFWEWLVGRLAPSDGCSYRFLSSCSSLRICFSVSSSQVVRWTLDGFETDCIPIHEELMEVPASSSGKLLLDVATWVSTDQVMDHPTMDEGLPELVKLKLPKPSTTQPFSVKNGSLAHRLMEKTSHTLALPSVSAFDAVVLEVPDCTPDTPVSHTHSPTDEATSANVDDMPTDSISLKNPAVSEWFPSHLVDAETLPWPVDAQLTERTAVLNIQSGTEVLPVSTVVITKD